MPIKGTYLAIAGAGGLFLWSSLRGKQWTSVLRNVLAGKPPQTTTTAYPITGTPPSAFAYGYGTGGGAPPPGAQGALAVDAESYVGKVPYLWGGATPRGWDCSGAFNWWACHDSGISIPGYKAGTFNGQSHGPNTFVYIAWLPFHARKIPRAAVTSGDVCLWQTHMGVALSNSRYVSAYDTQSGTCNRPINGGGPVGEIATFWRLR